MEPEVDHYSTFARVHACGKQQFGSPGKSYYRALTDGARSVSVYACVCSEMCAVGSPTEISRDVTSLAWDYFGQDGWSERSSDGASLGQKYGVVSSGMGCFRK